jgi:hypothetical protein
MVTVVLEGGGGGVEELLAAVDLEAGLHRRVAVHTVKLHLAVQHLHTPKKQQN